MGARLAFGMSMAIPFETYLIDELTSVGDARFSKRCDEVFSARRKNADIIMISHSMEQLREWCTQGIVLLNGGQSSTKTSTTRLRSTDVSMPEFQRRL